MLLLIWLIFMSLNRAYGQRDIYHATISPPLNNEKGSDRLRTATRILDMCKDVIKDGADRVEALSNVMQDNMKTAPYEVGYVYHVVEEKYRKMVDKYNVSASMYRDLYLIEHVMYLGDIEKLYWDIEHLVNMAHELEKKYDIASLSDDYTKHEDEKKAAWRPKNISISTPFNPMNTKTTKKRPLKISDQFINSLKNKMANQFSSTTPYWGFGEWIYGWDVKDDIEQSWYRVLHTKAFDITYSSVRQAVCVQVSEPGVFANPLDMQELLNELSWTLRLLILNEINKPPATTPEQVTDPETSTVGDGRRVGVQFLVAERRQADQSKPQISADENNMRLKLFRLMYETVRDSDLKVKRAELIQEHYNNATTFQIGYLMGDVTDKYTIMSDIAATLKRFYSEWKPIEHINAYEQIANQAIEINHLIDLMKAANKKAIGLTVPPTTDGGRRL